MPRLLLISIFLVLSGCDESRQVPHDFAACRVQAVNALGAAPPTCPKESSPADNSDCQSKAAIDYELRYGSYVQDCMVAAEYRVKSECIANWMPLGNLATCYFRDSW
jgi:hypothetical protein